MIAICNNNMPKIDLGAALPRLRLSILFSYIPGISGVNGRAQAWLLRWTRPSLNGCRKPYSTYSIYILARHPRLHFNGQAEYAAMWRRCSLAARIVRVRKQASRASPGASNALVDRALRSTSWAPCRSCWVRAVVHSDGVCWDHSNRASGRWPCIPTLTQLFPHIPDPRSCHRPPGRLSSFPLETRRPSCFLSMLSIGSISNCIPVEVPVSKSRYHHRIAKAMSVIPAY
jgi:hypothetical protein